MRKVEEAVTTKKPSSIHPRSEVRVGIVGSGTVGRASAEILTSNAEAIRLRTDGIPIHVTRIARKTPTTFEAGVNGVRIESDWRQIASADDVDIVVEAMGGTDIAYDVVRSSLEHGKAVVTANKALIALHGEELVAQALRQAQEAGYAEADPSLDLDGLDARDKIAILARIAFGHAINPAEIPVTGIRNITATDFHYAHRLNSTIRLVASAERTPNGIHMSVQPWLEPRDSMLAKVDGANNAIFIAGEKVGTQMLYGRGAGGGATRTAVLSDVSQIAR